MTKLYSIFLKSNEEKIYKADHKILKYLKSISFISYYQIQKTQLIKDLEKEISKNYKFCDYIKINLIELISTSKYPYLEIFAEFFYSIINLKSNFNEIGNDMNDIGTSIQKLFTKCNLEKNHPKIYKRWILNSIAERNYELFYYLIIQKEVNN